MVQFKDFSLFWSDLTGAPTLKGLLQLYDSMNEAATSQGVQIHKAGAEPQTWIIPERLCGGVENGTIVSPGPCITQGFLQPLDSMDESALPSMTPMLPERDKMIATPMLGHKTWVVP